MTSSRNRHRGNSHLFSPATPPYMRVRIRRFSSVQLDAIQKPRQTERLKVSEAVDVLVSVNDGAPVLLRNNIGKENHWLGVRQVGRKSNLDSVGARLTYQADDLKRSRMTVGGGVYLSSHDPRVVLGIGKR